MTKLEVNFFFYYLLTNFMLRHTQSKLKYDRAFDEHVPEVGVDPRDMLITYF